jgi:hypothetical protein
MLILALNICALETTCERSRLLSLTHDPGVARVVVMDTPFGKIFVELILRNMFVHDAVQEPVASCAA